jgi:hypothetical protein
VERGRDLVAVLARRRQQARHLPHYVRLVGRFARLERSHYAGAVHPGLWRRGFLSSRLYQYPGIEDPALPYVNDLKMHTRMGALNGAAAKTLLRDKNAFADALVARGLGAQAPEVYGTVSGGRFRPRSEAARERLRAQESVVLKPLDGNGGHGLRVVPGAEVEGTASSSSADLLVQERLRQHPVLARVNPDSLNTLRILALRLQDGPVIAAVVHRWGVAGSGAVDNVSSGGLSSSVDLETGLLGPAVGRPRDRRRVEHDTHPDTGEQIAGVGVPLWPEVLDLTRRLMTAFSEVDHVGWDLAVTDRGAAVIEGNGSMPNLNLFQYHGSFLQDERLREYYVRNRLLPRAPAG